MKKHLTLRVDASTIEELDRLARLQGLSRTELADRFLAESVRREEFPSIAFRDGALGRRAAIRGTRLDVWQVVDTVRAHDGAVEDAAAYLDLPVERVREAVRYAALHRDEVEDIAAREREAADRSEQIWRAERDLLAP